MNRREAMAALVALPEVARISVADVHRNDVIVIESERPLSQQHVERIRQHLKDIWPDNKVLVMDSSLKLKIAREQ